MMIGRNAILVGVLLATLAGGAGWYALNSEDQIPDERLPLPPLPPRIATSDAYATCLASVPNDPAGAASQAEAWVDAGGGGPALQCLGLAKLALGDAADGAILLQKAADEPAMSPAARAAVYGQAAQAWLIAGNTARAFAAGKQALSLAPDDPDLLVEHAVAAGALGEFATAIADLDRALAAEPSRIEALTLRGAARRHLEDLAGAGADIERALGLDPDNPEALLERGILRQRREDMPGARRDWERAIELAPDSPVADLAQQNLALLEAGPSR